MRRQRCPCDVVTVRPDPADPLNVSIVRMEDGETIRVRGEHTEVADKLRSAATEAVAA